MTKITNAQLRTALAGSGITVGATEFPDAEDALKAAAIFLDALQSAQVTQNTAAPTGEDVLAVVVTNGLDETIVRDSTTYNVRRKNYSVTILLQQLVGGVFGPLQ